MANLAIKGHRIQGDKVIKLLEMLGGENNHHYLGYSDTWVYYINTEGCITSDFDVSRFSVFTLEEFLEKFPYKVGDKVNYVKYNEGNLSVYTIQGMRWTGVTIEYLLDSSGFSALTKDLQPYKEEIVDTGCCSMPTTPPSYKLSVKQLKEMKQTIVFSNDSPDETELVLGDNYEVKVKDGKTYVVKKQPKYPKTYEECRMIINASEEKIRFGYKSRLLSNFQQLLICRDAYWKIAGNWKPDVMYCDLYCIGYDGNLITWKMQGGCRVLAFPTEEMRDSFYENFKELIEECKELL